MSDAGKSIDVEVGGDKNTGWAQDARPVNPPTKEETNGLEIEVVDDTPPEDRNRPRRDPKAPPFEPPTDEQLKQYSDNAQKRIQTLRYEYHEERRAREAAQREREEAIRAAAHWQQQANTYQAQMAQRQAEFVERSRAHATTSLEMAQRNLAAAIEAGKPEDVAAAQIALARAVTQSEMLGEAPKAPAQAPPQQYQQPPPQQWQQPQQQVPQQQPAADPKAVNWLRNNPWFGVDQPMTGYAYGLHEKLIKDGVHPQTDEYYQKIDEGMRKVFPEEFGDPGVHPGAQAAQARQTPVVPPARGGAPRKVQLTASQAAVAKRLGLTLEQYAAQLVKEQAHG